VSCGKHKTDQKVVDSNPIRTSCLHLLSRGFKICLFVDSLFIVKYGISLLCIFINTKSAKARVQDYLDSKTRSRNDVIMSLRFG